MTGLWSHANQERMRRWINNNFSLGSKHPAYLQQHRSTGQQSPAPKLHPPVCYNSTTRMWGIYWTRAGRLKGKVFLATLLLPQLARFSIFVFERLPRLLFTPQSQKRLDNNCSCPRRQSTSWLKMNCFVKLISHIFQFHQFSFKSSPSIPPTWWSSGR